MGWRLEIRESLTRYICFLPITLISFHPAYAKAAADRQREGYIINVYARRIPYSLIPNLHSAFAFLLY
jgi:hypothetical protein